MSEKFSLKWNDFDANVSKCFGRLRNEDYLHDVTLVTDDDHHVTAHKLVLSACSDYFCAWMASTQRMFQTSLIMFIMERFKSFKKTLIIF